MASRMWSLFPTGTVEDESPDPPEDWREVLRQFCVVVLLIIGIFGALAVVAVLGV
jgi:hypothetical protein